MMMVMMMILTFNMITAIEIYDHNRLLKNIFQIYFLHYSKSVVNPVIMENQVHSFVSKGKGTYALDSDLDFGFDGDCCVVSVFGIFRTILVFLNK